jgi:hypothetical protein
MPRKQPGEELPGMPPLPPLPTYGGVAFPKVRFAFSGADERPARSDYILDALALLEPDEDFTLIVSGKVAGHAHDTKPDADGIPHPVLTVKLKVTALGLGDFVVKSWERELERAVARLRELGVTSWTSFSLADRWAIVSDLEAAEAAEVGVDPETGEVKP